MAEKQEYEKAKPFQLCFVKNTLPGRSNIEVNKPLKMARIVTPKFYGKHDVNYENNDKELEKYVEQLKTTGPCEKYEKPLTENQTYGWYHQFRFTDRDWSDGRLNYSKINSTLVKEHLMNYEKIRD